MSVPEPSQLASTEQTLRPRAARALQHLELGCELVGFAVVVLHYGLRRLTPTLYWELGAAAGLAMLIPTLSTAFRYAWSRTRSTFLRENRSAVAFGIGWPASMGLLLAIGTWLDWDWRRTLVVCIGWTELLILARGGIGLFRAVRRVAAAGVNPAIILAASFALLIGMGTLLLLLPRARAESRAEPTPFLVALFTATSAATVTGLIVVDTGTYWSRFGQTVILGLFQIGGLGIMTFGAFFAVLAGRQMGVRESATLRDLLESERLADVGKLVRAIVAFTFLSEALGAVLISGLWPELPPWERAYYSVFHAVSAFCNAGFSLMPKGLLGYGTRWQVLGPMALLIIVGGFGFPVLYNSAVVLKSMVRLRWRPGLADVTGQRPRLVLTSRLVIISTALLLVFGTAGFFSLELSGEPSEINWSERLAHAWFQSVSFRSAGFNTVDHTALQPATKLLAVGLMFIGASPGSTGGGVKTICFALTVLSLLSVLRGRDRVEVLGRTIPHSQVNRALTIITLGLMTVMTATMLLVIFEQQPERFLDHLFEATSAFAIVGVSAGLTPTLTPASQVVLMVTMFLGRIGPLTLLIALAGRPSGARYEYAEERVTLG